MASKLAATLSLDPDRLKVVTLHTQLMLHRVIELSAWLTIFLVAVFVTNALRTGLGTDTIHAKVNMLNDSSFTLTFNESITGGFNGTIHHIVVVTDDHGKFTMKFGDKDSADFEEYDLIEAASVDVHCPASPHEYLQHDGRKYMLLIFLFPVAVLFIVALLFVYQAWKYDQTLMASLQGFGQAALLAKGAFVLLLCVLITAGFGLLMIKLVDENFSVDYWLLLIPVTGYLAGHTFFALHEFFLHLQSRSPDDTPIGTQAFVSRRGDRKEGPYYHLMDNPTFVQRPGKSRPRKHT